MKETLNPRYFERTFCGFDNATEAENTVIERAKTNWGKYVDRMLENEKWKQWWKSHDWLDVGDDEHSFEEETSIRDELKEAFLMGYLACYAQKLTGEQDA